MTQSVKLIHRFWAGRPMPQEYIDFGIQWQDLNPDYKLMEWNEDSLPHMVEEDSELHAVINDLFARDAGRLGIELFVQLADVVGYVIVEKMGGIYVNCDMQPLRPLPEMPNMAWASLENNEDGRIVNAAIGAPEPHNLFWQEVLRKLPDRYFDNPTAEMVETTGPALLTDCVRVTPHPFHVFPVETFNYIHWSQVPRGSDASSVVDIANLPSEVIALHHWGHRKDGRSNTVETATQ